MGLAVRVCGVCVLCVMGAGGVKSPWKGLDSSPLNPPTDSNLFYRKQKEAFLFPLRFSWCLRHRTRRPTGLFVEPNPPTPASTPLRAPPLHPPSFQALHCTILVQHDMHTWLLPSLAIKTLPPPEERGVEASRPVGSTRRHLWFLSPPPDGFARRTVAPCGLCVSITVYIPPDLTSVLSLDPRSMRIFTAPLG